MELILYRNRPKYYRAIEDARSANDSGGFIEFTLPAVLNSIIEQAQHQDRHEEKRQVELTVTQRNVLNALEDGTLSRKEIFEKIGISGDARAFKRHIGPLLSRGFIKMTVPDKPNSKMQTQIPSDGQR